MNFSSRHNICSWSQEEGGVYIKEGAYIRGNVVPGVFSNSQYAILYLLNFGAYGTAVRVEV